MKNHRYILVFVLLLSNFTFLISQLPVPPVPLPPEPEDIYKVAEEMPRFPGCEDLDLSLTQKKECAREKLLDYVYENLKYPEEAEELGIEGLAVVKFVIWKDGEIRDVKIHQTRLNLTTQMEVSRNIEEGIREEAVRIVESMNNMEENWRPGYHGGMAVCVQFTLPIKFKLEDSGIRKYAPIFNVSNVDELPVFPGCSRKKRNDNCTEKELLEFIYDNQLYPEEALKNNTEGIAKISFVIETDGTLSNIKPQNELPDGLCEDAIEIFEWMNSENMRWKPGKRNSRAVRTRYYAEVVYDLKEWYSRN